MNDEGIRSDIITNNNQKTTSITEDESIIQAPETAELPESVGDQYALISYLASQAKNQEIRLAAGKLLHRFSPELSVLLARDMINASAKFAVDPSYLSFAAKHQEFLK